MADDRHVHDCTGKDATCPCGYVLYIPAIFVSLEVGKGRQTLVSDAFNCETLDEAISALRRAADKLERIGR